MEKTLDVCGIGHAIVDVLAEVPDDFLRRHGIAKGTMSLTEPTRAEQIYSAMPPATEQSGGAAANTLAGVAVLGGRTALMAKTGRDALGRVFAHDIQAVGVGFATAPTDTAPTGTCLILVTPDAQRSMNTSLGAAALLDISDLEETTIRQSAILFLEGYGLDSPSMSTAMHQAIRIARTATTRVALTLADPGVIERHRPVIERWIGSGQIDILFGNRLEMQALFPGDDLGTALAEVRQQCPVVVQTMSEHGSLIITPTDEFRIAAAPAAVRDTTGAGDQYAAGFLYGLARRRHLAQCGELGSRCAARVIEVLGARLPADARDLLAA